MKKLMMMIVLLVQVHFLNAESKYSIHSQPSMTYRGVTSTRQSISGQTYFSKGRYIGRSRTNVFNGKDYYDNKGKLMYRATPNIFGGYNIRRFD